MTGENEDEEAGSGRLRLLLGLMGLLAIPLAAFWWPGCRQYPAVTSRESLGLMRLLYTACNTRDAARLRQVEVGVENLGQQGKMTHAERAGFERIIGLAKGGDWVGAERAAFKFAEDQVGMGRPTPAGDGEGEG